MPTIRQGIAQTSQINKEFVGTVAFRNEKLTLPDGSKVAIGIDGDRWVIVFQEVPKSPFVVYEYNASKNTLLVDKKPGMSAELEKVRSLINYFFENADCDDVVTIEAKVVLAV